MHKEIEANRETIARICRAHRVRRLSIFGSALDANFNERESDVDFGVEFEPLPEGGYAENYFGLLQALSQLLKRPVDLIEVTTIRNPYLKRGIEARQELLYVA